MSQYITKTGITFSGEDKDIYAIGDNDGSVCLLKRDKFEKDQVVFISTRNKKPSESDIEWIRERIAKSSSIGKTKNNEECLFILNDDKEESERIKRIVSGLNIYSFSSEFGYDDKIIYGVNVPLLGTFNLKMILENDLMKNKEKEKNLINDIYQNFKKDDKSNSKNFYHHKDLNHFFKSYNSEENKEIISQLVYQGLIDIVEKEISNN